jgi:hypothetical protein
MPRFSPAKVEHNLPQDGVHIFKVTKVLEKVSERTGYPMLIMTLETPDAKRISSTLTFCEAAKYVISACCKSAGLILPADPNTEVEAGPQHLLGKYLYTTVVSNPSELLDDPEPRVARFLTREQAIQKNPKIAEIPLRDWPEIVLPAVSRTDNAALAQSPNPKPIRSNPPF